MRYQTIIVACLLSGCLTACTGSLPEDSGRAGASKRARETADRLTSTLLGELTLAMKNGGPIRAIRYCAENAQDMTKAVGNEMNVSIRRVTMKPRNVADMPDAWEAQVLESFDRDARNGAMKSDVPYEEIMTIGGEQVLRFMRPIVVRDPCLTCHGTEKDIPPDVAKLIRETYPQDKATGYVSGDFRGAISITVPLKKM